MPRLGLCLGVGMGGAKWSPLSIVGLTHLWDSPNWYKDSVTVSAATLATANADPARHWTNPTGGLTLKSVTDTEAPLYRPTGGAGGGPAVEWDGSTTVPMFNSSGNSVIPAGQSIAMLVVAKNTGSTDRNTIAGRGGFNNSGFSLQFDSSNRIGGEVRNAAALNGPVIAPGSWVVAMLSYDGANVVLSVYGSAEVTTPLTGDLVFADNSFGIGAGGSSGGYAFWVGSKHIALVAVTRTIPDLAGRAALVANMAAYKGVA